MIIRVYIFCLMLILLISCISYYKKSKDTLLRTASFFLLLNVLSLAYVIGIYAFFILVTLILSLGIHELSINYKYRHPIFLNFIILGAYLIMLYFNSFLLYIVPFFFITAVFTFVGSTKIIKNKCYMYLFGVLVLATSAASLVALYKLNPEAVITLILLLFLNDVAGYLAGRKFGKVRIFRTLSPQKTLEGYIGSMVGILTVIIIFNTIIPILSGTSLLQNFILLIFFFVLGNAGDLLFSKIKRSLAIKDFSSLLPGHGGILDRFDNVFSVSPLFLLLLSTY